MAECRKKQMKGKGVSLAYRNEERRVVNRIVLWMRKSAQRKSGKIAPNLAQHVKLLDDAKRAHPFAYKRALAKIAGA